MPMPEADVLPGSGEQASTGRSVPVVPQSTIGQVESAYGADQIQVLEGLDAVRKRPGMYIGGTGLNALHHMVYEVVDNSIDEAMAGHATEVSVTIQPDGSCRVVDDGRGIPVEPMKHEDPNLNGRSAIEVVLTKLHAGGKFQQEGSAYKVSGGLHGVGVSCVNALSEYLDCEVYREGKIHAIGFERGHVTSPVECVGVVPENAARKRGTTVTFRPDPTIFPDITFNFETLSNRLRELSYLNPGVTLRFVDERVAADGRIRSETFRANNGLPEYVSQLMTGKTAVAAPLYFRREDAANNLVCEIAMQYHDGYTESLLSFANNINNVDGGTHAQGFKVSLTRALNGYARKSGMLKEKDPVPSGENLREGLVAIVSVKLPNPAFNNQPKEKLLNPEVESFVSGAVAEGLERWLEEHPSEAKRLIMKGILAAEAAEAARKAKELVHRKSSLDGGSMPHKLRDCKTRNVDESELYIVEGDSAGGSATQGRDVETQAILPLKGKILNVEKANLSKMLGFEEIRVLIAALRIGIGSEIDMTKLRYGKIIIMTDADVDGSHIRTLLLTFFFRQMSELIRRGHLYVAQPPLYKTTRGSGKNKKSVYVLNERSLEDALTGLALEGASLVVRDLSGLTDRGGEAREIRRIEGNEARRVVHLLRRMHELVEIAERRGVKFASLVAMRSSDPDGKGRLPTQRITWRGGDAWAWSEHQALDIVQEKGLRLADSTGTAESAETMMTAATIRELHENRELEKIFVDLEGLGIPVSHSTVSAHAREAVTGEVLPCMFAWTLNTAAAAALAAEAPADPEDEGVETGTKKAATNLSKTVEAANVLAIFETLKQIGRRGIEIGRFKGLGEMNPSQLWETTMDPSKRTLMKVTWDMGSQADQLFTILMGEEVEPRRRFIEEHALDVKRLDV